MSNFSLGEAVLGTGVDLGGLSKGLASAEAGAKESVGRVGGFFSNAMSSALGFIGANILGAAAGAIQNFAADSFNGAITAQQGLDQMDAALQRVQESSAAQAAEFAKASQTNITGTAASQEQLNKWSSDLAKAQARLTDMQTRLADKTPTETQKLQLQELQSTVAGLTTNIEQGSRVVSTNMADALGLVAPATAMTRDELIALSQEYKNLVGGSDDTIIAMETIGLKFNKIGAETFPRFIESAADLAVNLKMGPEQAATLLGKTLQDLSTDGTASIGRLRAAGVDLNEDQERLIKKLVDAGDAAGAQKVLLDALAVTTGGDAAAAANTLAGRMVIFKESIADAGEGVMLNLLPSLTQLATDVLPQLTPIIEQVALAAAAFITGNMVPAFMLAVAWVQANWPAIQATLLNVWAQAQPLLQAAGDFILNTVIPAFQTAVAWVITNWPAIQAKVQEMWAAIQPVLQAAGDFIVNTVIPAFNQAVQWIVTNWPTIQATIARIMAQIQAVIATVLTAIQTFWNTWGGDIQRFTSGVFAYLSNIFSAWSKAFAGDWTGFGEDMRKAWEVLWAGIQELTTAAVNWFTTQDWGAIGTGIIDGIKAGIEAAAGALGQAAAAAAEAAINAVKGFLGIHSPSAVGIAIGQNLGLSQAQGLMASIPDIRNAAAAAGGAMITDTRNFNIDARGATMTSGEIEAAVRRALGELGVSADGRLRMGTV